MTPSSTILWFRRDLRLGDNPALAMAAAAGGPVVPAYVWGRPDTSRWAYGAASRWWLHHSLRSLQDDLRGRGGQLIIRVGEPAAVLAELAAEVGAAAVVSGRLYDPDERAEEATVAQMAAERGLTFAACPGHLLFEPEQVRTHQGGAFRQFSAFWRACRALPEPPVSQPAPDSLAVPPVWPAGLPVDALGLLPQVDWAEGIRAAWRPGERGAERLLQTFLDRAACEYAETRDVPAVEGTSRLSPHLHFGEIGPRAVWHAIRARRAGASAEVFLSQLGWREFGHHLLAHLPDTAHEPLRPEFAAFPWEEDPEGLQAWQRGATGVPLVDAGMRQLWHTGWMHNRVRMVVASFLVKDLLVTWQAGAAWFWDCLVDADLANNTLGWQWSAGSGADAAPYFRIFNPVRQGERFDPRGDYVRRWVPELADVPARWVHRPWEAPQDVLAAVGLRMGVDYPYPLVDHAEARSRALAAFGHMRAAAGRGAAPEGGAAAGPRAVKSTKTEDDGERS